jgi:hypothetical protein
VEPAGHIRLFNDAVTTGDWAPFMARVSNDAILKFAGPTVGPYEGKAAIADPYAANPPDDTIERDEVIVPYRWSATGAGGTMRFTECAGLIVRLVVTFD